MRLRLGTGRMAKAGDIEETERERLERMELEVRITLIVCKSFCYLQSVW